MDERYEYMMMGRLAEEVRAFFTKEGDDRYFNENKIWAHNIKEEVLVLRKFWEGISEKPEWLSEREIRIWESILDKAYAAYPENGEKRICFIKGFMEACKTYGIDVID